MINQIVPKSFWVVAVLLLLWGLAGIAAFGSQVSMGPAELAALPPAQRDAFSSMPSWVWAVYGLATISGVAGSILLLLRKKAARPVYIVSLGAVIVQFGWTFIGGRVLEVVGPSAIPFPAFICAVGAFQIWYAGLAIRRDWIG